jgi:SAM-dependent methyltransferase
MTPEQFFEAFLVELESQPEMHGYYKFLGKPSSFEFRKAYFLQRLRYIWQQLQGQPKTIRIWDCGCGYGTTALFLAMNGYAVHGTTLEFYFRFIEARKAYWKQYGNSDLFTCSYENLFDHPPAAESYDWIIVQDTLHHLEPIGEALQILKSSLKPHGRLLAIEENGSNVVQRAKLYKYRGNKRIITQWDEKLQKDILIGNENIRSLKSWDRLFRGAGLRIEDGTVNYVRYYWPFWYSRKPADTLRKQEETIQQTPGMRREYLFFGLNFVAVKNSGR